MCPRVLGVTLDLYVCVRVCGCVGVWVCECVGVWVCGCVGVGVHKRGSRCSRWIVRGNVMVSSGDASSDSAVNVGYASFVQSTSTDRLSLLSTATYTDPTTLLFPSPHLHVAPIPFPVGVAD